MGETLGAPCGRSLLGGNYEGFRKMKFGKAAPSSSSNAWHIDHGSGRKDTQKGQSKSYKLGHRTKPSEQKTQNAQPPPALEVGEELTDKSGVWGRRGETSGEDFSMTSRLPTPLPETPLSTYVVVQGLWPWVCVSSRSKTMPIEVVRSQSREDEHSNVSGTLQRLGEG